MDYVKPDFVSLKNHPEFNEQWLQARIAEDPSLLGLGDLILKDKEKPQPGAGRLDLLLQDPESHRRYEVEIQLGRSDESHIIRTIEYWDIERRRYPQYDHCAVIVAEDITSRFLNVIGLFNGFIPLVAIQLRVVSMGDQMGLIATRVLDEMPLGLAEEDEVQEPTDRAYWEKRGTTKTLKMVDRLAELITTFAPGYELKYNKFYIGLAKDGQAMNFAAFKPQKKALRMELKIPKNEEAEEKLEGAGLEVLDYDNRWGHYRVRLLPSEVQENQKLLTVLLKDAYEYRQGG